MLDEHPHEAEVGFIIGDQGRGHRLVLISLVDLSGVEDQAWINLETGIVWIAGNDSGVPVRS